MKFTIQIEKILLKILKTFCQKLQFKIESLSEAYFNEKYTKNKKRLILIKFRNEVNRNLIFKNKTLFKII